MTFSLKAIFGIVAGLAVILAGIAATLRLPARESSLPGGLLFALIFTLAVIAVSRIIATFPSAQRFWCGFVATCAICVTVSFSDSMNATNVAPEKLAGWIWDLAPENSDSYAEGRRRFDALQGFIKLEAVLTFAVLGGLVASHRSGDASIDDVQVQDGGQIGQGPPSPVTLPTPPHMGLRIRRFNEVEQAEPRVSSCSTVPVLPATHWSVPRHWQ